MKRSVVRDLQSIPNKDVIHILHCFESLRDNPRSPGCEKLSDQERYRVRVGVYRVIYEIFDDKLVVNVVKVGHRRDIYRKN